MKKFVSGLFALMITSSLSLAAPQVYNDAVGDLHDGTGGGDDLSGFTHLDIDTVTMDSDALNLYITISVVANPITSPDWGKYLIGIDSAPGGDSATAGWPRAISMDGMDYWVGSWVDGGGGAELFSSDGATWTSEGGITPTLGTDISYTIPLADVGLTAGETFLFDVYTTGGTDGDSAVDALSTSSPSVTTWSGPFSTGANGLQYTVVPEPASISLILGAGLLAFFRRRK